MPKGVPNKKYTGEFKHMIIETMRNEGLSCISDRPVLPMVITMLEKAFATIPDNTNLLLHSNQGWQYQHKKYQRMLKEKGIRQSI